MPKTLPFMLATWLASGAAGVRGCGDPMSPAAGGTTSKTRAVTVTTDEQGQH
jgi:hypothetical protein